MRRSLGSSLFGLGILSSTLLAGPAHATSAGQAATGQSTGDDSPTDGALDSFVGSARQSIPIAVPSYRGLEPHLALTYDSSAGNGLPGVGWHLRGFGVIERVSATKGAPGYGTTDTFLLDGMALISCPAPPIVWSGTSGAYPVGTHSSWSPSCLTGGTHSALIENYQRIHFDSTANQWTVTQASGAVTTYAPIMTPAGKSTFRWGVSKTQDVSGNSVAYSWNCPSAAGDCYPSTVTYGPYSVAIHTETRPDPITYTDGASIHTITDRLHSVVASTSAGTLIRSYTLAYNASTMTGRSLLASVTQYGRDSTALPPATFSYLDGARSVTLLNSYYALYGEEGSSMGPNPVPVATSLDTDAGTWSAADVTGDGASDLIHFTGTDTLSTWVGSQDGRFARTTYSPWAGYPGAQGKFVTGDQDGDGKVDLLHLGGTYINTWISLGNGTYSVKQFALPAGTSTATGLWLPSDLNGDGKIDLLHFATTGATTAETWLSTTPGVYALARSYTPAIASYPTGGTVIPVDANGDGRTDIVHLSADTAYTWLAGGDGSYVVSSFRPSVGYSTSTGSWQTGDFNGDGKVDLAHVLATSAVEIWTSIGNGQYSVGSYPVALTTGTWFSGDFDGDGRADLVNVSAGQTTIALFALGASGLSSYPSTMGAYANGQWMVGDARGDGRTTLTHVNFSGGHPSYFDTFGSPSVVGNILSSTKSSNGGVIQYAYTPSSHWVNTNSPSPQMTVSAVTADDGRGTVGTTTYSYAGGLVDRLDRRFLGFHYAKKTMPSNGQTACDPTAPGVAAQCTTSGPIVETWYHQDYGSVSKPELTYREDGTGRVLSSASSEYTTNGGVQPYISRETGVWKIAYDGSTTACPSAGCKRTYTSRTYDMYGVPTVETFYGDYDVSGDERTVSYLNAANPTLYIVGLPYSISTYNGVGFGTLLEQTLYYYDNSATLGAIVTHGLATKTAKWESVSNTYVTSTAAFDAYGNRTSTTNALGAVQSTSFDATYHLFPTEVSQDSTPPSSCTMSPCPAVVTTRISNAITFDQVCGNIATVYDENNNVTLLTSTYDAFCRQSSRTGPLATIFQRTIYQNLGDPKSQYTETQTPGANAASYAWTRSYTDGFGRTYRKMTIGPVTGQEIITDTVFDARGLAQKTTPAYYASDAPVWFTMTYDALDRPSGVTNPDGTKTTTTYGVRSTIKTDEMGRQTIEATDAYGNIVKHTEKSGATTTWTSYSYDVRGNLIALSDSVGNTWSYSFNSLGQKTGMVDPDMGKWLYRYDAASQLVEQVDALGQHETFAYDLLGRKTQKTTLAGTANATTYTWKYDEVRAGYANVGMPTSTFTPRGRNGFTVIGDTRTMNYDAASRLVSTTSTIGGTAYTTSYGYDGAGRSLWTTLPDGDSIGSASLPITYDPAGRPIAIPGIVTSVTYDARGHMTKRVNANGTTTTLAFSPQRGFLTALATNDATGHELQQTTFDRAADGRIVHDNNAFAGTWSYAYDDLGRIASASNALHTNLNQTFAYDALGNMTFNSRVGAYVYPAAGAAQPHAVQSAGSNHYVYDANGNMVTSTTDQIAYDPDNRPTSITTAGVTSVYGYDGDGARTTKTVGGVVTTYLGDTYEVTNGVAQKYISLNGVSVAKRDGNGASATTTWIHTDRQGSVEVETDKTGQEVQRVTYLPYGAEAARTTTAPEALSYIGQRKDETGLLFLHARYYDPQLGRFLSPDPTVPSGSTVHLNRYAYSSNDPVNSEDPGGYDDGSDETIDEESVLSEGFFSAAGYGTGFGLLQVPQSDITPYYSSEASSDFSLGAMYSGLGTAGLGDPFGFGSPGDLWNGQDLGGIGLGQDSAFGSFFSQPSYGVPDVLGEAGGIADSSFGSSSALGELDMGSSLSALPASADESAFTDVADTSSFTSPLSEEPADESTLVEDDPVAQASELFELGPNDPVRLGKSPDYIDSTDPTVIEGAYVNPGPGANAGRIEPYQAYYEGGQRRLQIDYNAGVPSNAAFPTAKPDVHAHIDLGEVQKKGLVHLGGIYDHAAGFGAP